MRVFHQAFFMDAARNLDTLYFKNFEYMEAATTALVFPSQTQEN